ncbi:MAG: ABC transporter permease [Eubacteriales bacterium]|nr:ABC transporter permease [Eubacteriales bacterium]
MSFAAFMGAIELGMIYSILALGVFLSFRTLNTPDLTVDGSIVTGAAASAMICSIGGNPLIALLVAFILGSLAGVVTALLNTKLKIQPLLSGILVMLGIYSINLRIMGNRSNIALTKNETIYKMAKDFLPSSYSSLIVGTFLLILISILMFFFLKTRLGFALRATGDNEDMVRASGINSDHMKIMGLSLSNGLVGLSGGMLAQYQSYADIGMGVGMVVIGLASVIIGEAVFGAKSLFKRLIAVGMGAILYRLIIAIALNFGMPANDLKLVSAIIVTFALALGNIGDRLSFKGFEKILSRLQQKAGE